MQSYQPNDMENMKNMKKYDMIIARKLKSNIQTSCKTYKSYEHQQV